MEQKITDLMCKRKRMNSQQKSHELSKSTFDHVEQTQFRFQQ